MSQRLLIVASMLLLSICGAHAQAPSAQTPSADAMTAARSLVATMKLADQYTTLLPGIVLGLRPALVQDRPELERDFDAMMPGIEKTFAPYHAAITDALAAIYAANFTVRELHEIEAFYRQPVGQKLVEKTQVLTQQSNQAGDAAVRKVTEDLRKRLQETLRGKGQKQ